MIVDASAILAILFEEPEGREMEDALAASLTPTAMSPVNFLEASVRIDQLKSASKSRKLDELLRLASVEIARITPEQAHLAREAYRRYGKGNHEARLNLGDCFAYALAKARGEPLLFKGDDFRHTDIEAVL